MSTTNWHLPRALLTSLVAQMVKRLPYNVRDLGSIPESGRSSGEGNGNPLQYLCPENPMDGGYSPWGHKESDTTERFHFHFQFSPRRPNLEVWEGFHGEADILPET